MRDSCIVSFRDPDRPRTRCLSFCDATVVRGGVFSKLVYCRIVARPSDLGRAGARIFTSFSNQQPIRSCTHKGGAHWRNGWVQLCMDLLHLS